MIYAAALLAAVVAVLGFTVIERKRAAGTLTYPLWRGNLFLPWIALALLFVLVMGSLNLPRLMGLSQRGVAMQASVLTQDKHCQVAYGYSVAGKDYKGLDSKCGLKAGGTARIFYDSAAPENSTLYTPQTALKNECMAMGMIAVCLPTVLVVWLMMTKVIGWRKKA